MLNCLRGRPPRFDSRQQLGQPPERTLVGALPCGAGGVAVNTDGNVYVADFNNNRVLKLAAGATAPAEPPVRARLRYP
ncbi:hypothetical protein [Mycobacterium arosiense]|uniref:hypothetical protein n=1 Tax=Mycobacterium arosiense TaxID=425468 RepID=UPI0034D2D648